MSPQAEGNHKCRTLVQGASLGDLQFMISPPEYSASSIDGYFEVF